MFLILQFPFGDIRAFSQQNNRLSIPTWPQPEVGQYFRRAGPVKRRYLGGLDTWIGESKICVADHALKFSGDRRDFAVGETMIIHPCFRRFFFDGQVAGKFEVGFQVKCANSNLNLKKNDFEKLLEKVFSHPVRIPNRNGWITIPLISAGPELASLGYFSSSPHSDAAANKDCVKAGAPMLFVETAKNDVVTHRFSATRISELDETKAHLSHFWLKSVENGEQEIRCWFMNRQGDSGSYTRELRISLLRLNASRVGLEVLVQGLLRKTIAPAPHSEPSERLQYYLNNIVERCVQVPAGFRASAN